MSSRSRSSSPSGDDELRLPRVPGVIRRFWARHPRWADGLIAGLCLLATLTPAVTFRSGPRDAAMWPHPISYALVPLSIIACALLLQRRRWPVAAFIASLLLECAFLFSPVAIGTPLLVITSYTLAVYRSTRSAWVGVSVAVILVGATGLALAPTGVIDPAVAADGVLGTIVLGVIGTLIGANVGGRKRYIEAIIDRSRQLLVERDQQARLAASAERTRIAREMHDIVSHSLTVIVALAEGASATTDADRARMATAQVADTARGALSEMRAMLGVLRDEDQDAAFAPIDDDAAAAAVDAARSAGFPVRLRRSTSPGDTVQVPPAVRLAAGRVVQEGITNAMRHAPTTTMIDVSMTTGSAGIEIDIRNDGVRAPQGAGGYGLRGLQERVLHVGGSLESGLTPNGHWRLHAVLPLLPDDALSERAVDERGTSI